MTEQRARRLIALIQFAWLSTVAAKAADLLPLPWWLVLAPIWMPLLAVLALEARFALIDTWTRRRRNP